MKLDVNTETAPMNIQIANARSGSGTRSVHRGTGSRLSTVFFTSFPR
jgi:hypothetical protein